jgi:uncharacterized protein YceK
MSDVLHYSSRKVKSIALAITATLVLSGCSSTIDTNPFAGTKKGLGTSDTAAIEGTISENERTKVVKSEDETKVGVRASKEVSDSLLSLGINADELSHADLSGEGNSAWCRYLKNTAETEATIVGSPSLSASTDDEGSGSVTIGMNLLDFKKAELLRQSSDAQCRAHTASKKIEGTLGLAAEATSFAANWAKQDYLRKNLGSLNQIHAQANTYVSNGSITVQDKNLIAANISKLKAEMNRARSEADKRKNLPSFNVDQIKNRHGALVEATNDLQNIDREIRTTDALDLSVQTGYRYNGQFNNQLQRNDSDGYFASVKVGVKLGALSQRRKDFEDRAASARLDSLFEENTGTVWKSGFAEKSIAESLVPLRKSERSLADALAQTNNTISQLADADRAEVIRTRLMAKIQRVQILSDLAAVRASIQQLEENRRKIKALSN